MSAILIVLAAIATAFLTVLAFGAVRPREAIFRSPVRLPLSSPDLRRHFHQRHPGGVLPNDRTTRTCRLATR